MRWSLLCASVVVLTSLAGAADRVSYVPGVTALYNGLTLTDGTCLVAGRAPNLDWVPAGTPTIELQGSAVDAIRSSGSGEVGLLLHLSADLGTLLRVVHFPPGKVPEVRRIRSTEVPGQPTGDIYISGDRTWAGSDPGYYIARLNGNFVTALPTGLTWAANIECDDRDGARSAYRDIQPWDVSNHGYVIFARGTHFHFNWAMIGALDTATGEPALVEHWPLHWGTTTNGNNAEFHYTRASEVVDGIPTHSGIILKLGRSGQLRSTTWAEYNAWGTTANNEPRQGSYPDDIFYSEPVTIGNATPGYTGYRPGARNTARVGGVVIDRRNGNFYYGYCYQSTLPGGNPDFEPAVVAMNIEGELLWWDRLYPDFRDTNGNGVYDSGEPRNSTPDQYVDGLAIDYANGYLVVLARSHGNNVINFYNGNALEANPTAQGFQNRFTGTSGNIHLSWLGKFGLTDGRVHHTTYMAELHPSYDPGDSQRFARGLLEGWPNPNAGWPSLNTTRATTELAVDAQGRVLVAYTGSRPMTTRQAFQQMEKHGTGTGAWADVARIYDSNLGGVAYSTILREPWTTYGGSSVELYGTVPVGSDLLVFGWHEDDPSDDPMPTQAVPSWGATAPTGRTALLARLATTEGGPLPAPTDLTATLLAEGHVQLSWVDQATGESGYAVERSNDGGAWSVLQELPANRHDFVDTDVTPGATLYYRVRAFRIDP